MILKIYVITLYLIFFRILTINVVLIFNYQVNIELASSLFKVKIVVYSALDENHLNAMIFNNNYKRKIMLAKEKGRYSSVYKKKFMESAGICQNLVLNVS